jgi:hypothetical protein
MPDAALGRKAGVTLNHAVLHLDGAADGINHATELNDASVAGALHGAPVMRSDGGIEQIAPQPLGFGKAPLVDKGVEIAVPELLVGLGASLSPRSGV